MGRRQNDWKVARRYGLVERIIRRNNMNGTKRERERDDLLSVVLDDLIAQCHTWWSFLVTWYCIVVVLIEM